MTELHAVSTDASHESPWPTLRLEAAAAAAEEPVLSGFMNASVLNHKTLGAALAYTLARKLGDGDLNARPPCDPRLGQPLRRHVHLVDGRRRNFPGHVRSQQQLA